MVLDYIITSGALALELLISFFLPFRCVRCGKEDVQLCMECADELIFTAPECLYCGGTAHHGKTHPYCKQRAMHFDFFISCFRYHAVLKYIFREYKYHGERVLIRVIRQLLQEYAQYNPFLSFELFRNKNILLIPVPMHRNKLRERGYSSSQSVAEILQKILQQTEYCRASVLHNIVVKVKQTKAQAQVKKFQRFTQQLGVFALQDGAQKVVSKLNVDLVVIVDDVVSTGATAQSLLETLKKGLHWPSHTQFVLFSLARS
ncbi:MAG: hypothetical protein QY314_02180 [Candidatus Dojkabacteria bacterium]|nr:MAG: hypothetical protein QY314_02180 [Candidatus Dojkabacteria bacterium]